MTRSRAKSNRSVPQECKAYDFAGDTGRAAQAAEGLCEHYQSLLAPLGVRVVLGGSFKSGLAIPPEPGHPWDVDLRLLYAGDRKNIAPTIEALTGLRLRKVQTVRHGDRDVQLFMIEGQRTVGDLLFDIEGALRDTNYHPIGARYPELFTPEELRRAQEQKLLLRGSKSEYKAYKQALIEEAQRRMGMRAHTNGVHDPGILKGVFLAGGPGSGKTYVTGQLFGLSHGLRRQLSSASGLKLRASDPIFESLLWQHGINPKDLGTLPEHEFLRLTEGPDSLRWKASSMATELMKVWTQGRLGIIWDGTGDSYEKVQRRKATLERLGYDTMMVFVDTSLDVALARNRARKRSLPDKLVQEMWLTVQSNKNAFRQLFGDKNFVLVENDALEDALRATARFVSAPVQNPIGRQWMREQLRMPRAEYAPMYGSQASFEARANPNKALSRVKLRLAYRRRYGPNWWTDAKVKRRFDRGLLP